MKPQRALLAACLVVLAVVAVPAPASASGCSAGNCAWSLTSDWLAEWAGKDAMNPPSPTFADGYGDPGVWTMREGDAADAPLQGQSPGEPQFETGQGSPDGTFDIWHGLGVGSFGANLGPNTQNYVGTVTVPGHAVTMHPSSDVARQIDWTDPIPGTSVVSVAGSVADDDGNGGDGIGWEIWLNNTRLAYGSIANGSTSHQSFTETDAGAKLASITVTQGDQLRLIISAGPSTDANYDTTQVDFNVYQASGGGTSGQPSSPPIEPAAFSPTLQPIVSDGTTTVPLYAGTSIEQGAKLTVVPQCTNAADIQQCLLQINGPAGAGSMTTGGPLDDSQPGNYVANVLAIDSNNRAVSASFGFTVLSKKDYAAQNAQRNLAAATGAGAAPATISGGQLLKGGVNVPIGSAGPGTFAGIIAAGSGNVINAGAGNLLGEAGGNIIGEAGGNIIAAGSGNIIAAGSGNVINAGAGNLIGEAGGNIIGAGAFNRAFAARAKAVALGGGSHRFTAAGKATMRLRLSKRGRKLVAAFERRAKAHHKSAPLSLGYVLYFRSAEKGSPAFYVTKRIKVVR